MIMPQIRLEILTRGLAAYSVIQKGIRLGIPLGTLGNRTNVFIFTDMAHIKFEDPFEVKQK